MNEGWICLKCQAERGFKHFGKPWVWVSLAEVRKLCEALVVNGGKLWLVDCPNHQDNPPKGLGVNP